MVSEFPLRPRARWGWGEPAHPELEALFAKGDDDYRAAVDGLVARVDALRAIPRHADPPRPCWDNEWWGGLDAAYHVDALATRAPTTYLEVGSGRSTMFARHTIEAGGLATRIVSIDPAPRAGIDALCDEVLRVPFEEVGDGVLDRVTSGDVVLIDGSHMATMGSDAVVALLEVLPRLPRGVLVGVDDIFLPFDYHPTWADRWYGEQYVLAAYLLGGGDGYQVRFPGLYVSRHQDLGERLDPVWQVVESRYGRTAGTLWLERPA